MFAVLLNIILVTPVITQQGNQVDHVLLQSEKELIYLKLNILLGSVASKVYPIRLLRTKK